MKKEKITYTDGEGNEIELEGEVVPIHLTKLMCERCENYVDGNLILCPECLKLLCQECFGMDSKHLCVKLCKICVEQEEKGYPDILEAFKGVEKMVFWVCPDGCDGFVEWDSECKVATCKECGRKSTDK